MYHNCITKKMIKMNEDLIDIRKKKEKMLRESLIMPRDILHLKNLSELDNLQKQYPNILIIIDFTAVWCGPCQWFAPIFEKIQKEYRTNFIFVKVDVDKARDIAMQFSIAVVPTIAFLKDGKLIHQMQGALPYEQMKALLLKFNS